MEKRTVKTRKYRGKAGSKHMRKHKNMHAGKKTRRYMGKAGGGFLNSAFGAAKTALLPLIMYKAQKTVQRRKHKKSGKCIK